MSMQRAHIYLNFPGNADEALAFYATVFGSKVTMRMTFGEVPWVPNVPEAMKSKIMHAQLALSEHVHLMASDHLHG